jgi:hypothetical protein
MKSLMNERGHFLFPWWFVPLAAVLAPISAIGNAVQAIRHGKTKKELNALKTEKEDGFQPEVSQKK